MAHPWMNEGHALPFGPAPYPNRLDILDLDKDIVQHMVCILKVGRLLAHEASCSFCALNTVTDVLTYLHHTGEEQ